MDAIFESKDLNSIIDTTKGTEIMNLLLLSQYKSSPLLIQYFSAFIGELDLLFEQVQRVYYGRMLEYATGAQLDKLGEIVDITREYLIDDDFFGFLDSEDSGGFSSISFPGDGEEWRSYARRGTGGVFSDDLYKRAIRAKGLCNGPDPFTVDFVYKIVGILLNKIPNFMILEDIAGATLFLSPSDVSFEEDLLIRKMIQYFIPAGTEFKIEYI